MFVAVAVRGTQTKMLQITLDNGWGSSVNVSLDEIGKTLFKTKEETEANLPQPPKGE